MCIPLVVLVGLLCPSTLLAGSSKPNVKVADSYAVIENSHYLCAIDWRDGVRISRLVNKDTGVDCLLPECRALPFVVVTEGSSIAPDLFKAASASRDGNQLRLDIACSQPAIRARLQRVVWSGADSSELER